MRSSVRTTIRFALIGFAGLLVLLIALKLLIPAGENVHPPLSRLDAGTKTAMVSYLRDAGLKPEEYIVSKFRIYDVVLLGENHRVQQDPLFVQRLIPVLYRNGIRLLGFEFASREDQSRLDHLVNAPTYDESLAIGILRNFECGIWPYREYLDIFRAAWALNARLPHDSERFRILPMTSYIDGEKLRYGTDSERKEQERCLTSADSLIGEVVEREALEKGKKILVYCGFHHAFSRFRQPMTDDNGAVFSGRYFETRGGQRIYHRYPGRVIMVKLHSPHWYPAFKGYGLPFGGVVDQVFQGYRQPVGFDIAGSPFAGFRDSTSVYALGRGSISFSDFCDGYIVLDEMKNFRPTTVIPAWLDGVSFSQFKRHFFRELPFYVIHPGIFLWMVDDNPVKNYPQLGRELEQEP